MVPSLSLALASTLFVVSANAELLLAPRISEYQLDGVVFKQLAFSDDRKTVTYQSPPGWDYSGSGRRLVLHPKDRVHAEATVTRSPMCAPMTFDEEGLTTLAQQALASVPEGSSDVQIVSQEKNTIVIDHKETFLITMSYIFYGGTYRRSLMFMDRDGEQFCFQLTCEQADFEPLQRAFHASLFSWQGL